MNCLAIIPAKGTSGRLPRKNYRTLDGELLVGRAIRTAQECRLFSAIIVSTDNKDDRRLLEQAQKFPPSMPTAIISRRPIVHSGCAQVCFDVLAGGDYRCDSFALLVPSSPLRTPELLRAMWEDFQKSGCDCLMSFGPGGGRHDGTAIFCRTEAFIKALDFYAMCPVPYFVPAGLSCDVNTEEDLRRAEEMLWCREQSA